MRAGGGPARRLRQPNGRAHVDLVRLPARCNIRGEGVGVSSISRQRVVGCCYRRRVPSAAAARSTKSLSSLAGQSTGVPFGPDWYSPELFSYFKSPRRRRGSAVRCSNRFTVPSIQGQPDGRASTEISRSGGTPRASKLTNLLHTGAAGRVQKRTLAVRHDNEVRADFHAQNGLRGAHQLREIN